MTMTTTRLGLPLIEPGQAQKEMFHNEALALLDMLVGTVVEAVGTETPPTDPVAGECWILGMAPEGVWTGYAQAIAGWTAGGWRFVRPVEGLGVRIRASGRPVRWVGTHWHIEQPGASIADPAGGATVDAEARGALAAVLALLRASGMVAA